MSKSEELKALMWEFPGIEKEIESDWHAVYVMLKNHIENEITDYCAEVILNKIRGKE